MSTNVQNHHPAASLLVDQLTLAGYRWRWLENGPAWCLLVDVADWRPTGREFAAFPDDAAQLLEMAPEYPFVRVQLEAPPAVALPPSMHGELKERLLGEAARLEALSQWQVAMSRWLVAASDEIDRSSARLRDEANWIRRGIEGSLFGDWYVNGCDQFANTVKVQGRDMKLSPGHPSGHPEDLETIFLGPLIDGVWKADYRPQLRVEAADYGSSRVKVQVGRRGRAMPSYWVDLRAWTLSSKPGPAARRSSVRPRTSESAR